MLVAYLVSLPRPASRARMMAWARSATCSLVKMFETWFRTVFGLRWRRFAISGFVSWRAMSSRISRSRSGSVAMRSPCGLGRHRQAGELRPESVAQVASEPAPFLLLDRDQAPPGALEVGGETYGLVGQPHGMGRDAYLVDEVAKQPPVRGREGLLTSARAEHEPSDRLSAVD